MKKIGIGELRERITIQSPVKTDDGGGGAIITWTDLAEVWASVEPVSSHERYYAQQISADTTHRIRIRYRSDVKHNQHVKWGTSILKIVSIIDLEGRKRFLELLCEEQVVNEG